MFQIQSLVDQSVWLLDKKNVQHGYEPACSCLFPVSPSQWGEMLVGRICWRQEKEVSSTLNNIYQWSTYIDHLASHLHGAENHHTKWKELLYLNSQRDFTYSWILHEMNATAIDCQKTGLSFLQPGKHPAELWPPGKDKKNSSGRQVDELMWLQATQKSCFLLPLPNSQDNFSDAFDCMWTKNPRLKSQPLLNRWETNL